MIRILQTRNLGKIASFLPCCCQLSLHRDLGLLQCLLFSITNIIRLDCLLFTDFAFMFCCLTPLVILLEEKYTHRHIKFRHFVLFVLLVLQTIILEQLKLSREGKIYYGI